MIKTSIVVLTFNKLDYTKQCIESIRKYTNKDSYELIVVDNNSSDGTKEWLSSQKDIIFINNDKNLGFPKGCNQGIEVAKGDSILLLNNDTVVTTNWLENLNACLYSSEKIGAVGPVTNSSAYYQAIDTNYNSMEKMQDFAKEFNKLDKNKYEERLKLIGFCMLIKREVIEKIGLLDEMFTPGNYEDDDYSVRIRRAGYKLVLCNDTFIHHYGGISFGVTKEFKELLIRNEEKFENKWGFTSQKNMKINRTLINLIDNGENEKIRVLEIGCGCGATLLYLKNKQNNAEVYGVDKNKNAIKEANFLNKTLVEDVYNIEKIVSSFNDIKFDCIFINDILSFDSNNKKLFEQIKYLLCKSGKIFVEIENANYRNNIKDRKTSKDNITPEYVIDILTMCKYEKISGIKIKDEYDVKSYIINAEYQETGSVGDKEMENLLIEIEKGINFEENINKILKGLNDKSFKIDELIIKIKLISINKSEMLNTIAVKAYENELYDYVIPMLQASLDVDEKHKDTLINMGLVLDAFGEYELAVNYLEKVEDKDDEIKKLIEDIMINHIIPKENIQRKLKYLLRRIENNIESEESREEIYTLISSAEITGEDILDSVDTNIIKKDEVLNSVAVKFYEKEFYEEIIPLFQKSYDYNPDNFDTIYNLGYFLYELGEKEVALSYFEKIQGQNQEVDSFIIKLKGEI